jgi:hypothetical protein
VVPLRRLEFFEIFDLRFGAFGSNDEKLLRFPVESFPFKIRLSLPGMAL